MLSKLYDLLRFKQAAKRLCTKNNFEFVHCRSYVACEVGLYLKKSFGLKYVFDMRGFWVDERKDANIWDVSKPWYKLIYEWYKKKERRLLENADAVVSLTQAARSHMLKNFSIQAEISVIPCAADLELFRPQPQKTRDTYREKMGIGLGDYVLVYLGSVGTWYMLEEMLDFFKISLSEREDAKFLFVTNDACEAITDAALERGISADSLIIIGSKRHEVPLYLSTADAAIFFIRNYFSKTASSPTKHGELLGCGLPIICNDNIGDLGEITRGGRTGVVINEFSEEEYLSKFESLCDSNYSKDDFSKMANEYYSLQKGIEKYLKIYSDLDT